MERQCMLNKTAWVYIISTVADGRNIRKITNFDKQINGSLRGTTETLPSNKPLFGEGNITLTEVPYRYS